MSANREGVTPPCEPGCELDYPHTTCARLIQRPPEEPEAEPSKVGDCPHCSSGVLVLVESCDFCEFTRIAQPTEPGCPHCGLPPEAHDRIELVQCLRAIAPLVAALIGRSDA